MIALAAAMTLAAITVEQGVGTRGIAGSSSAAAAELDVWEARDAVSARTFAWSEGHRVEVTSSRAETSSTYVNPDGTFTTEMTTQPVRMLRGGKWISVDTTLVSDASGVHPRAVPDQMLFSGGGDDALATVVADGETAGLRWLAKLPRPILAGDVATYRDVAPNIDLTLKAARVGFEVSISLKKRPANPKATYRLPLGTGVTAAASQSSGVIVLTDGNGHQRGFVRPTVMFDSQVDLVTRQPSHTGAIDTTIATNGHEIDFTPQAGFLSDPATRYPVTIDPTIHLGQLNDMWVASSGAAGSGSQELRVGYVNGGSGPVYRSFMKFDVSPIAGAQVSDAALALRQWSAPNCTAKESRIYALGGPFTDTTTWQNQPSGASTTIYGTTNKVYGATGCATNWLRYDTTNLVQKWADGTYLNYGLLVRQANEADTNAFWRFYGMDYTDWAQLPSLAVTYTPPPTATAPYPPSTASVNTTTPTLSMRYDSPSGASGFVRYEVYDSSHTTVVASGQGNTVLPGSRSSWTVSAGKLVGGSQYSWRAQPQGSTTWSEYADLIIDPLNGDALPASAPLPTAPPSVKVVAADGGAWITWGEADPGPDAQIDRYEVTAATTGTTPTTSTFTANADARSMAVTSLQNGSAYEWAIRAIGSYGSGPSSPGGTAVATPVPNGPANFQSIAQSYLVAKGRLVTGYAPTPQAAADSTEASAAIGEEVNATGNDDISTRSYLARSGIAYTSYAVSLSDSVAYWTPDVSPPTITLQVTADETLNQTADNIAADPELRSVRYTFTFTGSGSTWKIGQVTQPAEPQDTTPDVELDTGAPPNETPVPLATNSDGTFATNPDSTQPQAPSGTLDYYAISNYVHRYSGYYNHTYNPAYIRWINDCTNFASQALYAGRRHMRGGLYTSVGSWYYGGFIKKASWTWGGAKNLFTHLAWTGTFYPKYTSDAAVGDLLFWDDNGDGTISHVSVVVRRIGKTVYYGQHSNDYDNRTIEAGLRGSPPGTKVYDFRITG